MYVDGMLYGGVVRTKYPRALIKSIDISAAVNHPRVEAVLTAEDIPGERYWGFVIKDWPTLVAVGKETRYIGDALALVAADTRQTALEAVALVKVEYEQRQPLTSPKMALATGAYLIHSQGNLLNRTVIQRGNAAEGLAQAACVVTQHYSCPSTEHAFMEPESALAVPRDDDGITVYVGSQSVYEDQLGIMHILNLSSAQVKVVSKLVGGGFGGKEDLIVQHHAALLAHKCRKPVKLTLSRQRVLLFIPNVTLWRLS